MADLIPLNQRAFVEAGNALRRAEEDYAAVTENLLLAEEAYEEAKASAYAGGLITGANEAQRKAVEWKLLRPQRDALSEAKKLARHAELKMRWAKIDRETLRLRLLTAQVLTTAPDAENVETAEEPSEDAPF